MKRINADVDAILKDPQFRAKLASDGSEVVSGTPEEFPAYVKSEAAKWEGVVKSSGAKVDQRLEPHCNPNKTSTDAGSTWVTFS